jgi:hypothetical protein
MHKSTIYEVLKASLGREPTHKELCADVARILGRAEPIMDRPKIVRAFSVCGPCLTLGRLTKETEHFYCFDEWQGADRFEGTKRVAKRSPNHIEPCSSCRDHPKTQYPNGYMD